MNEKLNKAARNPKTPVDKLLRLSELDNETIDLNLLLNPNCPALVLNKIIMNAAAKPESALLEKVSSHRDASSQVLEILYSLEEHGSFLEIRRNLVFNPNTPPHIYNLLKKDPNYLVLLAFLYQGGPNPSYINNKVTESELIDFIRRAKSKEEKDRVFKGNADGNLDLLKALIAHTKTPIDILEMNQSNLELFEYLAINPNTPESTLDFIANQLKSNLAHKKIIKYEVLISLLSNPKIKSNHFDDFKHYKDVHFILVRNKTTPAKVLNFIFNFKENYQDDWDKINIWNRIAVNPNTDTETVLALSKKGYNMTDHPNYPENMRKVRKLLKIS
jgi:hypothetical protein